MSKAEWAALPIEERAEMVAGFKLPDWLGSLDLHQERIRIDIEGN